MVRFVTVKKFAELTGYSPEAISRKISRGVWAKGAVWMKAPDGRRLIDNEGYEAWVQQLEFDPFQEQAPN